MNVMTKAFHVACQRVRHASLAATLRPRIGWLYSTTILVVALLAVDAANAQTITWTTLDYPDSDLSGLLGIDGTNVVGHFSTGSGFTGSGFRYDGVTYTPLDYPSGDHTLAAGIDGANIVGWYDSGSHGFLYDGAVWTSLDFPGADYTEARGISGTKIVGYYGQGGAGTRGYLFDGVSWTTLQHPDIIATAGETLPYDIDGDTIVGEYVRAGLRTQGFVFDGDSWTTLSYPGAVSTSATNIDGVNIVGFYEEDLGLRRGFLYDGTTWTSLDYPGAQETFAHGISGDRVVGSYIDEAGGIHGFIATISTVLGDFDFDGDVDGRDFLIWQRGGSPAPLSAGDLATWQANYGGGSLRANSVAVPEPTTLTLLMLATAGGRAICRRARPVSSTHQRVRYPINDPFRNGGEPPQGIPKSSRRPLVTLTFRAGNLGMIR